MENSRLGDDILRRDRKEQLRRRHLADAALGIASDDLDGSTLRLDGGGGISVVRKVKSALANYFLGAHSRTYGFFFLIYGIFTLLLHFADYYISTEAVDVFYPLLCGAVCSLVSIPLLIPDAPIYKATDDDPLISAVLYDFFCFKHFQPKKQRVVLKKRITIPMALLLSVLGFFTNPWLMILVVVGLILLPLALSSPEFPFLLSLLLLPYFNLLPHATILLASLVLVALVSYLRKVIIGNRTFTLRAHDIVLVFFCLFYLISGIFNGSMSSFTSALMMVLLTSGCTLATGLIVNRRIADSAIGAIGLFSFPVSLYAVYQYFFTTPSDTWSDPLFSEIIRGRVTGTFHNPNVLAMFLVVASVFALYHLREAKTVGTRLFCTAVLLLHLLALLLTFSRGAYLSVFFTFFALLVLRYAKKPGLLLTFITVLPYTLLLVPASVTERILSTLNLADSSIAYRLSILRSSLSMFSERIFLGVGVGEETFRDAFFKYAEEGTVAPHSHNLLLEIGCEAGIFALIAFLVILFVRARHTTLSVAITRRSTVRLCCVYSMAALFALLLFGFSDYIWSTYAIYYLFWIVYGIGGAALAVAKRERDDRTYYYGDGQSPESSIVDIRLH